MVTIAKRVSEREQKRLRRRIEDSKERGGVSASLFLEGELNALPEADCFFFAGTRLRPRGLLSVFFPDETQAEITVAEFVSGKHVLQTLFATGLRQCHGVAVKEVYTVVDPAYGFCKMEECGVHFSYAWSEYMLCRDMKGLAEVADGHGKKNVELRKEKDPEEGVLCYRLLWEGRQVASCFILPTEEETGCYLFGLATEETVRRQGFATALLAEIAKEFAEKGDGRMRLQVSSKNGPAERLYRKLGFWTEEQRKYYKTEEC